jgi:hypothetical protein
VVVIICLADGRHGCAVARVCVRTCRLAARVDWSTVLVCRHEFDCVVHWQRDTRRPISVHVRIPRQHAQLVLDDEFVVRHDLDCRCVVLEGQRHVLRYLR